MSNVMWKRLRTVLLVDLLSLLLPMPLYLMAMASLVRNCDGDMNKFFQWAWMIFACIASGGLLYPYSADPAAIPIVLLIFLAVVLLGIGYLFKPYKVFLILGVLCLAFIYLVGLGSSALMGV